MEKRHKYGIKSCTLSELAGFPLVLYVYTNTSGKKLVDQSTFVDKYVANLTSVTYYSWIILKAACHLFMNFSTECGTFTAGKNKLLSNMSE